MTIKQTITQAKADKIYLSLQYMYVIANTLLLEHANEIVDADFRIPYINQFAKRIKTDTEAIVGHLKTSGKIVINAKDQEFLDEYSSAIWEITHYCVGLPLKDLQMIIEQVKPTLHG